jgi:anti-sigma regulatory factor (Ser/Thr protein kinase)
MEGGLMTNNVQESHLAGEITVDFPSDLDYVQPLRQFISDLAKAAGFTKKYCFRTEIIVDELSTNAIVHGSETPGSQVHLQVSFAPEGMNLSVADQGGPGKNLDHLKRAIYSPRPSQESKRGRGLVIVQMLSDELLLTLEDSGATQVKVVKRRGGEGDSTPSSDRPMQVSP